MLTLDLFFTARGNIHAQDYKSTNRDLYLLYKLTKSHHLPNYLVIQWSEISSKIVDQSN